jgi:hypothetical protein
MTLHEEMCDSVNGPFLLFTYSLILFTVLLICAHISNILIDSILSVLKLH